MSEDIKALTALLGVLAYALREISLIEKAPDTAINAIAAAYDEVETALAKEAGADVARDAAAQDISQLN